MTGPRQYVIDMVLRRADGMCERCGRGGPEQIHHRKPRGAGGTSDPHINSPSNLLALCSECHREVERNRTVAYEQGWLVHRKANPALTPVWLAFRGFSLLTSDGQIEIEENNGHMG
jgi:5-methylcytosine-specific restriction endonuclease McrA